MKTKTPAKPNHFSAPALSAVLTIAVLLVAGCVVTSVYPFYQAKDVTFDPAMVGTWSDPAKTNADQETWTFEKLDGQTYKLVVRNASETNQFDTHLFSLGDAKFLDCLTRERPAYAAPTHVLLRVKSLQPQLEMQLLDYEWLGKLIEANPKALRHIIVPKEAGTAAEPDGGLLTLTADTAELQRFIRQHLNDTNAWSKPLVLKKP
jgi:hypothetical protein